MSNVVLQAQAIDKTFADAGQRLEVIRELDLSVAAGEAMAVLGASGSGKSTLLQLMAGLDVPDAGSVSVAGQDLASFSAAGLGRYRNQHIGFVYQFHYLLPEFSALENVAMPLLIAGMSANDAEEKAAGLLARVGLSARLAHRPAELSGGERQRAAVARALITEPSVVLADEPTGNLDRQNAEQVMDLMLQLNGELNTAIVLVTHDEHLAAQMPRRVRLQDGQLHPV